MFPLIKEETSQNKSNWAHLMSLVPDGRGLENRELSWGAAGLSMSVAGEVGIGNRSPVEESWPLRLWEGGDVGPSLLAEDTRHERLRTV